MLIHIILILRSEDIFDNLLEDFFIIKHQQRDWMVFKCFLCVGATCYLFAISTLNYFLSAFMTTILVPVIIFIGPPKSSYHRTFLNLGLLAFSASGLFLVSQTIYQFNWSSIVDIIEMLGLDISALKLIKPINIPQLWLGMFKKWFKFGNPFYPSLFIAHQAAILGCVMIVNGFAFNMQE
eukprot:NODE_113_length_18482_cov_1.630746.p14 type:complete len:180 gc:universal NODE_113_length_18482_cov_1.630746:12362-12901(+)